jgi:predicted DCC family thiol-disulfide oxidoreductase YuxK
MSLARGSPIAGLSINPMPERPVLHRAKPLFVFDGHCVLCSGGASFIMRHDPGAKIQFASAQSDLGRRLYEQLRLPIDDSYLFIDAAGWHIKSDGYVRVAKALGGWWRLALLFRIVPRFFRDWIYDRVAANRYEWFGKSEQCALLSKEQRSRLVEQDPELEQQLDAGKDLPQAGELVQASRLLSP